MIPDKKLVVILNLVSLYLMFLFSLWQLLRISHYHWFSTIWIYALERFSFWLSCLEFVEFLRLRNQFSSCLEKKFWLLSSVLFRNSNYIYVQSLGIFLRSLRFCSFHYYYVFSVPQIWIDSCSIFNFMLLVFYCG